jgi:CheY-like chemotaxis protein
MHRGAMANETAGRRRPETHAADRQLPRLRILAAEDNRTNQLLLTAMLVPLGAELHVADDGATAVEAFAGGEFDLVLMDVQMPVMNGLEAARAIRALEAERGAARTPILALSADALDDVGLPDEVDGWVAKPIAMAILVGAIEAALAGRARAA